MAKFGKPAEDDGPSAPPPQPAPPPAAVIIEQQQAPPPPPPVTVIDTSGGMGMGAAMMNQQNFQQSQATAQYQAQASVGLAQTNIDQEVFEEQSKKEDEHWVKAFWRPAMGWLYMLICAFDFIIAPVLSMLMPIFLKSLGANTVTYAQWQSLTLSNGGLIHLAFGAILGISAYGRTQEKTSAASAAATTKPPSGSISTT